MKHYDFIYGKNLTYNEALALTIRHKYSMNKDYASCFITRPEWDGIHFYINFEYAVLTKDNTIILNPKEVYNTNDNDWMVVDATKEARELIDIYITKNKITIGDQWMKSTDINVHNRGFEFISVKQIEKDFKEAMEMMEEFPVFMLPNRATKLSAGYDCYAPFSFTLEPGDELKVPTGIRSYMQPGEVLMAFPRSGLGFKYYCRLANTIGVIDTDYYDSDNEGHIFIKIRNEGNKLLHVEQGEAFCQLIFMPFLLADGDDFKNGIERNGGFGSTTKA